jgi:hypothetical protein
MKTKMIELQLTRLTCPFAVAGSFETASGAVLPPQPDHTRRGVTACPA